LSLIFIGGNIERVADLATNIGEDVPPVSLWRVERWT
jgi:phosphate uptake regulator